MREVGLGVRRPLPNPNYSRPVDITAKAAYAICRNTYRTDLQDPETFNCVCHNQGRGQVCDQMQKAAIAVIQEIVKEYGK